MGIECSIGCKVVEVVTSRLWSGQATRRVAIDTNFEGASVEAGRVGVGGTFQKYPEPLNPKTIYGGLPIVIRISRLKRALNLGS